jgi:hypothetical protein
MCDDEIIKAIETKYPETCQEFKRIQKYQYLTFCKKQFDYGPGNISLGSTLETFEERKASISAIVVRLNDKLQRLINIVLRKGLSNAANESVLDTFLDTSVYCIIAEIVNNQKWSK